jgi:hypothetical protein
MLSTLFHKVILVLASALLALSPVSPDVARLQQDNGANQRQLEAQLRLGSLTPVQAQKFRLAGSGVTATANTIVLQSFKLPDASTTIAMADLGTIAYGTLEPGTSKEEQISFTGVTQNANGTATLTGVTRGLDFRASTCTAVSANQKTHAGGSYFILSNTACFYSQYPGKGNTESITGAWTFATSNIPRLNGTYTYGAGDEEKLVTYRQLASTSFAGVVDGSQTAKGIFEEATQAELAAGTQAGGTSADLVAPARYFNATPSATTIVPVTNGSGKLAQGFWDLTQAFVWSGAHSWSATSTFTGSASFSTSTFSVIPTLPASDPTTDNQAARKAYVDSKLGFYAKGSVAAHTGTLTETTLASHTITGGAIGANGRMLVTIFWRGLNSGGGAGTQTLRIKYGGTTLTTVTHTSPSGDGDLKTEIWMDNLNSASSQAVFFEHVGDNSGTPAYVTNNYSTATVTSSSDQTLAITGQLTDTGHSITIHRYTVQIISQS